MQEIKNAIILLLHFFAFLTLFYLLSEQYMVAIMLLGLALLGFNVIKYSNNDVK
ncbi:MULTISPECIES: hypothetical protein [Paraclostridium]|uniref:Uncharacterized protein n=1 Tax=Paraclostridium bifermentans TaxID=1490 RepID=A0AA44DLP0_PARBF|nr:hypothetical protein [Paraclostridium bifermentans]MBN8047435.1 hypothetical protein [Paraclostridium bifermentans]MBZ6004460.1 hypothetical protein [Paraclostridium bifermentans]MCU9809368.1 hypothetical protein [Paraclostridium sp. AKS46]NME09962.1 hypothetical protein [Paraclostridium bifermentans]